MEMDIGSASAEETSYATRGASCFVLHVLSVVAQALASSQNHPRQIPDLYAPPRLHSLASTTLLTPAATPSPLIPIGKCIDVHGRCGMVLNLEGTPALSNEPEPDIAHGNGTGNDPDKEPSEEPRR